MAGRVEGVVSCAYFDAKSSTACALGLPQSTEALTDPTMLDIGGPGWKLGR